MLHPLLVALSLLVVAAAVPEDASAQTRRVSRQSRRDTRGSTRRAGSREARGSRDLDARRARSRRRRRRWRRRWEPRYTRADCLYVDDGWCYYDRWDGGGAGVSMGFSLDYLGGIVPTDPNSLSTPRGDGSVDAGLFATTGGGARLWLLYDRLRAGILAQGGGAFRAGRAQAPAGHAIEAGSRVGDGWWWSTYGFVAYQPQLSASVALWLGGRVGVHALTAVLEWEGRRYDDLDRVFLSAGPEVGVMLSGGSVGLMIWAFTDLAQPGLSQLSLAFVFEEPRPDGPAF